VFYGWWVVGAGFTIALYVSGFVHFGFTAIFQPIADEFGWSHAQVSVAASMRGFEMGVFVPILGFMVDRFGPRRLIAGGAWIAGLGLLLLSRVSSLAEFYGAFVLVALGTSACVGVVPITAVNNWFHKRATLATGILVSGTAAGGALIPLATKLIDSLGWQGAVGIIGLGTWVILVPVALLFRHRPEHYGFVPDGARHMEPVAGLDQPSMHGIEGRTAIRDILKHRGFWHVAFGIMLHILVINAVVAHIMPYLGSTGMSRAGASLVASAVPLTSVVGRLGFGWLGDRFDGRFVTAGGLVLTSAGLLALAAVGDGSAWILVLFVVLFGVGYGGPVPMLPALLRAYYGNSKLGSVLGLALGAGALGGFIGPLIAGWGFDRYGTYEGIWIAFAALVTLGVISLLTAPSLERQGEPAESTAII